MCYNADEDYDRPLSTETLRAIEEAKRIVAAWRKIQEEEYNTPEVIDVLQYDYDNEDYGDEIPNETTLHAMAQAKKIIEAWRKMREEE